MTTARLNMGAAFALSALILSALILGGCASTRLSRAELLAEAGMKTTGLLARDVAGMSRQLADGDAATAFSATWGACKAQAAGR